MALSKAQKAARAQKRIDEARLQLAAAEADGAEAGLITAPAIGGPTKKNTSTVWIGLKLPNGLKLRLSKPVTMDKPIIGGGIKQVNIWMPDPDRGEVRLRGYAVPYGKLPRFSIIGDYALTEVDRAWWNEWKEQNAGSDLLKKGLIFEHGEKGSVEAYAEEHAELKCGLEALNPNGDKRAQDASHDKDHLSDIESDMDRAKSPARNVTITL